MTANAFIMPENSQLRTVFIPNELLETVKANSRQNINICSVSNGANVTLSAVEAQKLQLGQNFASVRQITDSCWAIRNTLFNPVSPKPTWYDELNGKFNVVKGYADEWIDKISIAVTSTIPSSVIDFVPLFTSHANAISAITHRSPGILSPNDLITVREILTRVVSKVDEISTNVDYYAKLENGTVTGKLVDWQKNMSDAQIDLKSGSSNIQKAVSDLAVDIQTYNQNIESLKKDIAYYNKLVATGAGLVGVGAFVGSIGFGLCFVFPIVGGIVLAISGAMIIGGSVTWAINQKKINTANNQILDYKNKIDAANQAILALNSLSAGVDLTVDNARNAVKNLANFAASWVTFGNSLKSTLAELEKGGRESMGALVDLDLQTSTGYWNDVKIYAQGLLDIPTGVKTMPASQAA